MVGELDSEGAMRVSIVASLRKQYSSAVSPAGSYSGRETILSSEGRRQSALKSAFSPFHLPSWTHPWPNWEPAPYRAPSWLPELPDPPEKLVPVFNSFLPPPIQEWRISFPSPNCLWGDPSDLDIKIMQLNACLLKTGRRKHSTTWHSNSRRFKRPALVSGNIKKQCNF